MGRRFMAGLMALAVGLLAFPGAALANGVPIQITLAYLSGISNYGPRNAVGIAEVVMAEGEVKLKVTGLPRLEADVYGLWLLNTVSSDAFFIDSFNADAASSASRHTILPQEIPDRGYNLLLVTVEPKDKAGRVPDVRRSIAGYFPVFVPKGLSPAELPKTGGDGALAANKGAGFAGEAALVLLAGGVIGIAAAATLLLRRPT